MPKSQALTVVAEVQPEKAAYLHHHAHLHLAIGASYAVLCGVELQRIQAALPESPTRWTFDQWLSKNRQVLGFERSMAFSYKGVAGHVKSKLLVNGDDDVLALLDRNPASLSEDESKLILKAVNKAVDGASLRELLTEMKITRDAQLPDKPDATNNGSKTKVKPKAEQLIQDQLWLPIMGGGDGSLKTIWEPFDEMVKAFHKPTKDGDVKAPLWQHAKDQQKRDLLKKLETQKGVLNAKLDAMIAPLKESLGK